MNTIYYNIATGSAGAYNDWYYTDENGESVNGVDRGELLEITPNGPAYLDYDTARGTYYTTLATDQAGTEYRLIWLVSDDKLLLEADECCDWSRPDYVIPQ